MEFTFQIINIIEEKDISQIYEENMKKWYPGFVMEEPVYKVTVRVNMFGKETTRTEVWKKSVLERNKEIGSYVGDA